jgi:HPt (histidine-containing phosphotransfer) domain-containing protein
MGNNWNLLHQTLHLFYSDFSNKRSLIDDYVAKDRWQDASQFIHTIKGAASQIGAQRLSETSRAFELELESKSSNSLNTFRTEFLKVLKALENLPEIKTEPSTSLDHMKLKESVQTIFSFIAQSQFVPPDLINETIQQLDRFGQKELGKRLKRSIDQFDYTTAREMLLHVSETFNFTLTEEP